MTDFYSGRKALSDNSPLMGLYFFITNQEEPTHEFLYGFYHRTIIRTDCCSKPDRLYQKSADYLLAELTSLGYTPELSNKEMYLSLWEEAARLWYWLLTLIL